MRLKARVPGLTKAQSSRSLLSHPFVQKNARKMGHAGASENWTACLSDPLDFLHLSEVEWYRRTLLLLFSRRTTRSNILIR